MLQTLKIQIIRIPPSLGSDHPGILVPKSSPSWPTTTYPNEGASHLPRLLLLLLHRIQINRIYSKIPHARRDSSSTQLVSPWVGIEMEMMLLSSTTSPPVQHGHPLDPFRCNAELIFSSPPSLLLFCCLLSASSSCPRVSPVATFPPHSHAVRREYVAEGAILV